MKKIATEKAPAAIGPYSQAVSAGDFLFVSGQLPIDAKTGALIGEDIESQTREVLKNIGAILEAASLSPKDVVKAEIYLKDMGDFKIVNELYGEFFSSPLKPARQTMQVAKLPLDVRIEISCIAFSSK